MPSYMLAKPENREEAVAKLFKSVGGRIIGWYLTFGHHDWMAIREFPDEKAAASAILAAASVRHRDDRRHDSERCSRHLRICRKGGEGLPERRALIGSGETHLDPELVRPARQKIKRAWIGVGGQPQNPNVHHLAALE